MGSATRTRGMGRRNVALSADGNTLASAIGSDPENEVAYVLERSGGVWEAKAQKLVPGGVKPEFGSRFGASIAISENGDTILFGAPYDRGSGFEEIGGVWVFVRVGETWVQQTILEGEPGETLCGVDVALSADGDTALVKCDAVIGIRPRRRSLEETGADAPRRRWPGSHSQRRHRVRHRRESTEGSIYQRSGETWSLVGKLDAVKTSREEGEIVVAADEEHLLVDEGEAGVVLYTSPAGPGRPRKACFPWLRRRRVLQGTVRLCHHFECRHHPHGIRSVRVLGIHPR